MDHTTPLVLLIVCVVWAVAFLIGWRDELADLWRHAVRRETPGRHAHHGGR